jgi:hypothetical protein
MNHPSDFAERPVEVEVGRCVGRRPELAFDHSAIIQGDQNHLIGHQFGAGHSTRLDGEQPGPPINPTDIPKGQLHEPCRRDLAVCCRHPPPKLVVLH